MSRRKPIYLDSERDELLARIGECRKNCTRALGRMPINSPLYRALRALTGAMDDVAEVAIGDRTHFHLKMHKF